MIKLRIINPGHEDRIVTVEGDEAVIGRGASCDIVIPESYVSGQHAKLLFGLVVVDLGSTNGTFANGERVREATLILDGSFQLGAEETDIRIEIAEETNDFAPDQTIIRPEVRESSQRGGISSSGLKVRLSKLEDERARMEDEVRLLRGQLEVAKTPPPDVLGELRDEVRRLKDELAQADGRSSGASEA